MSRISADGVMEACTRLNGSMAKVAFVDRSGREDGESNASAAGGSSPVSPTSSAFKGLSNTFKNATSKLHIHQTQSLAVYPSSRGCSLVSKNAFDYSSCVHRPLVYVEGLRCCFFHDEQDPRLVLKLILCFDCLGGNTQS